MHGGASCPGFSFPYFDKRLETPLRTGYVVHHRHQLLEIHWAIYRRNLDGSEPRYYLSNAPEDTPLETLAHVGGSRWRIETEFETEKSDVGLDEYETGIWAGWHHHVALCLRVERFS